MCLVLFRYLPKCVVSFLLETPRVSCNSRQVYQLYDHNSVHLSSWAHFECAHVNWQLYWEQLRLKGIHCWNMTKPWKSDPSAPRPLVGRSDPEAGSKPSSRVPQHLRKWEDKGWWSETSWLYNNSIQWYWLWKMTCLHFTGWSCGCSHQLIFPLGF